jgi:hypothetical protein
MITERQRAALRHFRRYQGHAPNWVKNKLGPWFGLNAEDREADILTANWVPNRAEWRAQGFKNYRHAQEVLG